MAVINRIYPMIGALLILCSCATAETGSNEHLKQKTAGQDRVPGEYLVKIKAGTDVKDIEKLFKPYGLEKISPAGVRLYKIKLNNDPGPEIIKEVAEKSKSIEYAEPNYIYRINPPTEKRKLQRKD